MSPRLHDESATNVLLLLLRMMMVTSMPLILFAQLTVISVIPGKRRSTPTFRHIRVWMTNFFIPWWRNTASQFTAQQQNTAIHILSPVAAV